MEIMHEVILKDAAIGRIPGTEKLPATVIEAMLEGAKAIALLEQISSYATKARQKRAKRDRERERARSAAGLGGSSSLPGNGQMGGARNRWTPEEDEKLSQEWKAGMPIQSIAEAHARTAYAIAKRLQKLGHVDEAFTLNVKTHQ